MSNKLWFILVVATVIVLVVVVGLVATRNTSAPTSSPVVGNDKDAHGCIISAGYSWCQSSDKCYRPWEESCQSAGTFAETGNLTKPKNEWVLVYEKPGKPALTAPLILKNDTVCMINDALKDCKNLTVGQRVQIQGDVQTDRVIVSKITIIQ